MPTFNIKDSQTGMEIRVSGQSAPQESDIPQLFNAAKRNAEEQLATGAYKQTSDFQKISKPDQYKRIQKLAAAAMGTSVDDVDVNSGMGLWERTKLDFMPDESSRMNYLEKKFGADNVSALNVGGKTKMFYRDPKTNKMTMVDEMGASLADFTADIAGEAVTTAGAIGGAIVGSALGPGGTIAGATAGAGIGGFLTGVTQDIAATQLAGVETDTGQILKQRGIETAIGVPIDLATAGVGRIFSRSIAGKGAQNLVKEFDIAAKRVDDMLAVEKASLPKVAALRTGVGSKQASEIAAARPTSKLAKELQSVRDRVGLLKESLEGRGRFGVSTDEFNRISDKIADNYKRLISEVEVTDKALARELKDQASRKMQKLIAPQVSEMEVGGRIRELIAPGVERIEFENNLKFDRLKEIAAGRTVSTKSVLDEIQAARKEFARLDDPESAGIAKELEAMLKGKPGEPVMIGDKPLLDNFGRPIMGKGVEPKKEISFQEFRELMDEINGVISRNKDAGFSTRERVASKVLTNLTKMRSGILSQDQQLGDAFEDAMGFYKDSLLATRRSAVGRTLREQLADPAITKEQVARLTVQDPEYIDQALRIARASGGGEEAALKAELRNLYLNRIGLSEGMDVKNLNLTFNEDIIRKLWGTRQLAELKNLQRRINQMKDVDIVNIDARDVNTYLNALSANERSQIIKQIKQRNKNNTKLDRLEINTLNKMLAPVRGERTGAFGASPMSGMELSGFAEKFVKASPDQVKRTVKLLEDQGDKIGMQAFRQSYIGKLFDSFSGGAQVDRYGNPLWNPVAFAKAMKPSSRQYINAKAILGKDGVDDLIAANKVLLEASETTGKNVQEIFQPRYSLTRGGLQLYGVGNLIGGLRGRAMAWAYSNRLGATLMRFLVNPGDDEATEAALRKILPALMTSSKGLQAVSIQSEIDPDFADRIAPLYQSQGAE